MDLWFRGRELDLWGVVPVLYVNAFSATDGFFFCQATQTPQESRLSSLAVPNEEELYRTMWDRSSVERESFYKWLLLLLLYSNVEASCIVHSIWCLLAQTVSIALSGQTHQTYLPLISIYTCYSKLPPCYCMKKYQGNGIHRNVAANMVHNVTRQNGDYC